MPQNDNADFHERVDAWIPTIREFGMLLLGLAGIVVQFIVWLPAPHYLSYWLLGFCAALCGRPVTVAKTGWSILQRFLPKPPIGMLAL